MLANDIKKGMRVQLANGFEGTMMDNGKGNTRCVRVEGIFTETGSVYTKDIVAVAPSVNAMGFSAWEAVELSPKQKEQAAKIRQFGF